MFLSMGYRIVDTKGDYIIYTHNSNPYCNLDDYSKSNCKYGLMKTNGEIVYNPKYNDIDIQEDYIYLRENKTSKLVLVDQPKKVIFNDMFYSYDVKHYDDYVVVETFGLSGNIIDYDGRIITFDKNIDIAPISHSQNKLFSNERAIIIDSTTQKRGYIDLFGNIVIEAIYDWVSPFYKEVALVKLNDHFGLIDTSGNLITDFVFDSVYLEMAQHRPEQSNRYYVKKGEEYGYIDLDEFEFVSDRSFLFDYNGLFIEKSENHYGVINESGEVIVDFLYDHINFYGQYIFVTDDGKQGVFDLTGNVIIDLELDYEIINPIYNEYIMVRKNDQYGVYHNNGTMIIPVQYEDVYLAKGYFIGRNKLQYQIYNIDGQLLMNDVFDDIRVANSNLIFVQRNHRWYLLKNNHISEISFKNIRIGNHFISAVKDNYYWGYLDQEGNELTDFKYFSTNEQIVEINRKYGMVDELGNLVIDIKYDSIDLRDDYVIVQINKKYGIFDYNGLSLIDTIYDRVYLGENGLYLEKNGEIYSVNSNFEILKIKGRYFW